jgi:hypothetical protein
VGRALKGLAAGLALGVVGTLLVAHFTADENIADRLEDALHCDDGWVYQTAATAHHTAGYSMWAATHGSPMYGIGCNTGPATIYLQFSPYRRQVAHALATMEGYGPVCVVDHGFFEGRSLGPVRLQDLCAEVGGEIRIA